MVWHIANTTIRTPYRLREALIALQGNLLNGNLEGKTNESAFAKLLNESGIVDVQRLNADPSADVSDLGRKWRSALSQLGFITHKLKSPLIQNVISDIPELSGRPFEITPSGYRLISAEPITAQQEAFLRSLLAYRIPSPIETRYTSAQFSPLKFVIDVVFTLQIKGVEPSVSFQEFALFIQTKTPQDGVEMVADNILGFRKRKEDFEGHVRQFYKQEYSAVVLAEDAGLELEQILTKGQTLNDYADLTLRYLKATGLFKNKGHGIILSQTKEEVARYIYTQNEELLDDVSYLKQLWIGATLPTDDENAAATVVKDLANKVIAKGGKVEDISTIPDINIQRHVLEEKLLHLEEIEYYKNQSEQTDEILGWMKALLSGGSATLTNGDRVSIPKAEAPAYLEWVIWRAFLAINSLVNTPWEARGFQIDQDFLPVTTAPGGRPDMVFEFDDAIVVVEVTLTTSSRQEAAEGEPVRRHVAKFAESFRESGKSVYGLFLAVNIDSNTAHTFRMGDWFLKDDSKINLEIVPIKLEDFYNLFLHGTSRLPEMPQIIQNVLLRCRAKANQDAPLWKESISNIIKSTVSS